jgi:N-acetyl-anhydromuramyl-L-alanine amidase AmpD
MSVPRRTFFAYGLSAAGALIGQIPGDDAWVLEDPPIIDCDEWGARPNSAEVSIWDEQPIKIIVHHTATANTGDFSRASAERLARSIQNFHIDVRGWLDTGQHFTISRGGFVLEGRHHSLEALRSGQHHVEGAHCTGQNDVAVGIENEGTYGTVEPTAVLWDRLREMCAYICHQYEIPPTELFGHRDFKDTACPGDVLYGRLPQLRSEVAQLLGQRLPERAVQKASWPLLRIADRGRVVQAVQHLLRAAGQGDVAANGRFDRPTADAVREFQAAHRTEEVNGMIGGESWPLLVAEAPPDHPDFAAAVQAVGGGEMVRLSALDLDEWQQVLTDASASGH